jgi:hypothetical protein
VPPNKGQRYPADPPTVEEVILVMRQAGPGPYADRTRGLIAILWRAGLRISEALALTEIDLDPKTGSVLPARPAPLSSPLRPLASGVGDPLAGATQPGTRRVAGSNAAAAAGAPTTGAANTPSPS